MQQCRALPVNATQPEIPESTAAASVGSRSLAHTQRPAGWVAALALFALAFLAYGPSLSGAQFLNFDDNFYFGPDDAVFQAATLAAKEHGVFAGLAVLLSPGAVVADVWLPVAHVSLWLDAWWGGGSPFLPHANAVALHAIAGWMLLRLLLALRLPWRVALPAACAFVVHPALCESVAWVSGRKDLLSGIFAFWAIARAARCAEAVRARDLGFVALLTALAMLSKATAVVVPPLCAIALFWLRAPLRAYTAPIVAALAALPIAWLHQHNAAIAGTMAGGDLVARLPQVPAALLHYAATTVWPTGLNVLHPEVATLERFRAAMPWAASVLLALLGISFASLRSNRWRATGLCAIAFFVALLPFNTAYPASVIGVADRYLYLASPWLLCAVFSALPRTGRVPIAIASVACILLLLCAWSRSAAFATSERLWLASLEADSENAVASLNLLQARAASRSIQGPPSAEDKALAERALRAARYPEHERRAHLQLAQFALQENRFQAAAASMQDATVATERVRDSGRVRRDVAESLLVDTLLSSITPLRLAGLAVEAERALDRARSLRPEDPRIAAASALLAVEQLALEQGGKPIDADDPRIERIAADLQRARAAAPFDAQLDYAGGVLARMRGQSLAAIAAFRRAAKNMPSLSEAWVGAAEVCLEKGLASEAEEYSRQAISIAVQGGRAADPRLRLCLARSLQGQGRLDEAIGSLRDYCDQTGLRDREAARLLSGLYMHKARQRLSEPDVTHAELESMIERALRYNPNEPAVDLVRARIQRDQRQFASAIESLQRLQKSMPDLEDTVPLLAENLRDLGYERMFAKDDLGAAQAWVRCLQVAPGEFVTDAVRMQLQAIWRRQEKIGIEARKAGDEAAARAAFRMCLRIDPSQHWAAWLLVAGLVEDPGADLAEIDALSGQALAGQRAKQLDASRQVGVRALALRRLGRSDEARVLLRDYLAAPDAEAPAEVLQVLSRMLEELSR